MVLLKSVFTSMLIHLLVAASLPKGVLVALEKIFVDFLWGTSDFGTNFHWIRWEALWISDFGTSYGGHQMKEVLVCGG